MKDNYGVLRKLEEKDALFMHEWMQDREITKQYQKDFSCFSFSDIKQFIHNSYTPDNMNFAFVNEKDEYMGTVSLKNISQRDRNAEYAIVSRKCAQRTGMAQKATRDILHYAFYILDLEKVYLNVMGKNEHAITFYTKMGFRKEGRFRRHLFTNGQYYDLEWYSILKEEYKEE